MFKWSVFLAGVFIGILTSAIVGLVLTMNLHFPLSVGPEPEFVAPHFPEPVIHTKRQYLMPVLPDEQAKVSLILTSNATGAAAMIINKQGNERSLLSAWVAYQHLSDTQASAAVAFTLGLALQNWKTFALLVVDGQVVDEVVCWQCDVGSPDFKGAELGDMLSKAHSVQKRYQTFEAEDTFETALAKARTDPSIVIHATNKADKASQDAKLQWTLETWEPIGK